MLRGLYTAVSGLVTLEKQQSNISNNISNATTTGFKNDILITKSFDEVMLQNKDKVVGNKNVTQKLGTISLGAEIDNITTLFTQGDLKSTEKSTDFAIDGRGFFVAQRNTGAGAEAVYTRDGNFKVGVDGYLMTSNGDKVLGVNRNTGAVEPIFVGAEEIVLDSQNNLFLGNVATHNLATADFEDYSSLEKIGDNYYRGENPIMNANVSVEQGYLESSNVNIANEMINMMTTMRSFETNQRVVSIIDETLKKAANEVGSIR